MMMNAGVNICPFPSCDSFTVVPEEFLPDVWRWDTRLEPNASYEYVTPSDADAYAIAGTLDNLTLTYYLCYTTLGGRQDPLFMGPDDVEVPTQTIEVMRLMPIEPRIRSLQERLDARVDCSRMRRMIKHELHELMKLRSSGKLTHMVRHYESCAYPLDQVHPDGFFLWK